MSSLEPATGSATDFAETPAASAKAAQVHSYLPLALDTPDITLMHSTSYRQMKSTKRCTGSVVSFVAASLLALQIPASAQDGVMRLRMKDGSFSRGYLSPSSEEGRVAWKSEGLLEPLELDVAAIRSVVREGEESVSGPGREVPASNRSIDQAFNEAPSVDVPSVDDAFAGRRLHRFELLGGSSITGQLMAIDDASVRVASLLLGELRLARKQLICMTDADYEGELVSARPLDDSQWESLGKPTDWDMTGEALRATRQGAAAVGELQLPARAQVDFQIAWEGVPDFVFSFGTLASNRVSAPDKVPAAVRVEVWDKHLALIREVGTRGEGSNADMAILADLITGTQRAKLTLYIDQLAGTISACDAYGRLLATITAPPIRDIVRSSVHLVNNGSALSLQRFEVRQWDGVLATRGAPGKIVDVTGRELDAVVTGYNSASDQLEVTFQEDSRTELIAFDDIRHAYFSGADGVSAADAGSLDTAANAGGESVEVLLNDRSRLKGAWLAGEAGYFRCQVDGIAKVGGRAQNKKVQSNAPDDRSGSTELLIRPDALWGVVGNAARYSGDLVGRKNGILVLGESQWAGCLLENSPDAPGSHLLWQPLGSLNASEISLSANGSIIYRKPLPSVVESVDEDTNSPNRGRRIVRLRAPATRSLPEIGLPSQLARPAPGAATRPQGGQNAKPQRELTFRSGDTIFGAVTEINSQGIYFSSAQTSVEFAPHGSVNSVQIGELPQRIELAADRFKRLKTVPRKYRNSPPTHLLVAVNGDYLRCRMLGLISETLRIEIGGSVLELPTSNVAQIIWLHERDWQVSDAAQATEASETITSGRMGGNDGRTDQQTRFRVHVMAESSLGLTFEPSGLSNGTLFGSSAILGECQVNLSDVNQLLFGADIENRLFEFRQNPWRLQLAPLPNAFRDGT